MSSAVEGASSTGKAGSAPQPAETVDVANGFTVQWQFKKADGVWQDFKKELNTAVEEAFREDATGIKLEVERQFVRGRDESKMIEMDFNFIQMTQRGDIERKIRRVAILAR